MKTSTTIRKRKMVRAGILAAKIGVGSVLGIYLATLFHLENAAAAGTITLLTLVGTKWETLRLIIRRYLSFALTVGLCILLFEHLSSAYFAFGTFLLIIVAILEMLGWESTLSVNALIGMHFMSQPVYDAHFILNEMWLLTIGVTIAYIFNLFYDYEGLQKQILHCIQSTEQKLSDVLENAEDCLLESLGVKPIEASLRILEREVQDGLYLATMYQNNTYNPNPECYVDYFEMRQRQYLVLHNLVDELGLVQKNEGEATLVAGFISFMRHYITRIEMPMLQMERLQEVVEELERGSEAEGMEGFEHKAMTYHLLMSLRKLLVIKLEFLETMTPEETKYFFKHRI